MPPQCEALLALAPTIPIRTHVRTYPLESANDALDDLRAGRIEGAAVIDLERAVDDPKGIRSLGPP